MNNILDVPFKDMCCSCGVCVGGCPKQCISLEFDKNKCGKPVPVVDSSLCVECGFCKKICGGYNKLQYELFTPISEKLKAQKGNYLELKVGNINKQEYLDKSTSGGICTGLICELLRQKIYDVAFGVVSSNFSNIVATEQLLDENSVLDSAKSKYVSVSHENAIRYINENRESRVILVGTSCALESIRLFIEQKKLNRSNYLLIGLFCDKSMTYQIWNYYASKYSDLKEMYFRSKDGGGWPGSFCIRVNEENILLNKKERMRFKDYFCHERCLYCTDKLNMNADISLGDNYTGKNDSIFGTSSIIIRSFQGKAAFEFIRKDCALYEIDMETIARSQELGKKKENGIFSQIKFGSEKQTSIRMYIKYCYKRLKIWSGYYAIKYPWIMKLLQAIKS